MLNANIVLNTIKNLLILSIMLMAYLITISSIHNKRGAAYSIYKSLVSPKSNLVCLYYNRTAFTSCPIVAIVLPVTSKGNKIDINNPNPSQLLLMNYFYPSFLSTIEPSMYEYRVYIGYSYDDKYLSKTSFLSTLKKKMKNSNFELHFIIHNHTRLVDMYNTIAKKAYDDGADYFITLNDDAILKTSNWTSIMVNSIHNNPILPEFGTTGFVGVNNPRLIQFNFISRLHMEIFKMNFYPPSMPNWGIDNWICDSYRPFGSCFLNKYLVMKNHAGNNRVRYKVDRNFGVKLRVELKNSIQLLKSLLDNKTAKNNKNTRIKK